MKPISLAVFALAALSAAQVRAAKISPDDLKQALKEHPEIVLDFIKEHKQDVYQSVSQAAQEEQEQRQKDAAEKEKKDFDASFKNPMKAEINAKSHLRGQKNAKYTLVEYSDFQCPYCSRGYLTVEELRKKYGTSLRVVFKNTPLPFHPMAMPAAQYLEATALQAPDKVWLFHDKLFQNQDKLSEQFIKDTIKELGLDVKKAEKDATSQAVKDKIQADMDEAKKFGFSGTPGFLLNGIPVRGAYPISFFDSIIKRLDEAKAN